MVFNEIADKLESFCDYIGGEEKDTKKIVEEEFKTINKQCNKFIEKYKGIIKVGFVAAGTILVVKYLIK